MAVLRRLLGDVLRRQRLDQQRTLREVAASARVSLGYLSEVERGQKEASSELLAAICAGLGVPVSAVLREVSDELAIAEAMAFAARQRRTPSAESSLLLESPRERTAAGVHCPEVDSRHAHARGQRDGAHPGCSDRRGAARGGEVRQPKGDHGRRRCTRRRGEGDAVQPLSHQARRVRRDRRDPGRLTRCRVRTDRRRRRACHCTHAGSRTAGDPSRRTSGRGRRAGRAPRGCRHCHPTAAGRWRGSPSRKH